MGQLYSPRGVIIYGRVMRRPTIDYTRNGKQYVSFRLQYDSTIDEAGAPHPQSITCTIFAADLVPYGKRIYRGQRLLVAGRLTQEEYISRKGKDKGQKKMGQTVKVDFLAAMVPIDQFGIPPAPDPAVERPPNEWEINQHPDAYF